jgi:hypothetical protein
MARHRRALQVRLCAYPAYWLREEDSFANDAWSQITWSTGARIRAGDIQVFCIDDNLDGAEDFANDPRVGAVHSLWEEVTDARPEFGNEEWPVQATFAVMVRLKNPVPKVELARNGLLATRYQEWPQNQKGIIFHESDRVRRLADLLCRYNPQQREEITRTLGVAVAARS